MTPTFTLVPRFLAFLCIVFVTPIFDKFHVYQSPALTWWTGKNNKQPVAAKVMNDLLT
jgi:hypothetical protein